MACALAGCLDAGPSPKGRHLLAGRDEESVTLLADLPGAAPRILLSHRQAESFGFSTGKVSLVDDPTPAVGPGAARMLIEHEGSSLGTCTPAGCQPPVDAAGRIYFQRLAFVPTELGIGQVSELVQVDLSAGQEQSFGSVNGFAMSASGTRFAFIGGDDPARHDGIVVDLDGARITLPRILPSINSVAFVGDDLIFVNLDGQLMRLSAGIAEPALLATGVSSFSTFDTQRGSLLFLRRYVPPDMVTTGLFDPATWLETALPPITAAAETLVPSPSGRYVASMNPARPISNARDTPAILTLTLFDRDTGREQTMQVAAPTTVGFPRPAWRPLTDEVWFAAGDDLWRWQPESPAVVVASGALATWANGPAYIAVSEQEPSLHDTPAFTPDGRFRVVTTASFSMTGPVYLHSADDAAAPPFLLNPPGTGLAGLWPLSDGRFLVEAWIGDPKRNDVYVADPVARTTRALTSTGNVIAVGRDRFLALQHWVAATHSGDLTLLDYATGAATLIAENVHAFAIDRSPSPDDALAPGTRVVYLVRNRIASPYDGCWAIDLP